MGPLRALWGLLQRGRVVVCEVCPHDEYDLDEEACGPCLDCGQPCRPTGLWRDRPLPPRARLMCVECYDTTGWG